AIYSAGRSLRITNSQFTSNLATTDVGANDGDNISGGGAVCWLTAAGTANNAALSPAIVMTGNTFTDNQAVGAGTTGLGGTAFGGAIELDPDYTQGMSALVANNTFTGNEAIGGPGVIGGYALGGSLAIDILEQAASPVIDVDGNTFRGGGAFG